MHLAVSSYSLVTAGYWPSVGLAPGTTDGTIARHLSGAQLRSTDDGEAHDRCVVIAADRDGEQ